METNKGIEAFYARTRSEWRQWLMQNGQSKHEVCVIIYSKKSSTEGVRYEEAVEEALCFGWIDSLTNKRDTDSVYQRFSPRKPNGNWSARNKDRVERLIKEGRMTTQGQKMIDIAIARGKY